jgi:hypothetical protein
LQRFRLYKIWKFWLGLNFSLVQDYFDLTFSEI